VAPPSLVTLPPLFADVEVISLIEFVVTVGALFAGRSPGLSLAQADKIRIDKRSTINRNLLNFASITLFIKFRYSALNLAINSD
jgi:hypothetical protein